MILLSHDEILFSKNNTRCNMTPSAKEFLLLLGLLLGRRTPVQHNDVPTRPHSLRVRIVLWMKGPLNAIAVSPDLVLHVPHRVAAEVPMNYSNQIQPSFNLRFSMIDNIR